MFEFSFPLFKGMTRLSTVLHVPLIPLLFVGITICLIAFWFGMEWLFLLPAAWFIMFVITKNDDKAFRILGLWFRTKFLNRYKSFWKASTYTTINHKKRVKQLRKR